MVFVTYMVNCSLGSGELQLVRSQERDLLLSGIEYGKSPKLSYPQNGYVISNQELYVFEKKSRSTERPSLYTWGCLEIVSSEACDCL